jgi:hypothetical protein
MKRPVFCVILAISFPLFFTSVATSMDAEMTRSMTGKVIGVDESGKEISISSIAGGEKDDLSAKKNVKK